MSSTRLVSLLGLGFGDCGKGLFTDYLCRRWDAHTVVRFNGGAQAGHNVVLPDGRHHTFAQFGAGSFVPGTVTVLAFPVIVHPTALLVEDAYLRRAGVPDALRRILIDGRCRVTTPFHQAAGRMRELQRGAQAHGSCGVGVGETAGHGIDHPDQIIHYADLVQPAVALAKLEQTRRTLRAVFSDRCAEPANQDAYAAQLSVLDDTSVATRWLEQVEQLTRQVAPASRAQVAGRLHLPGCVLFEGAQGVLLDEWRGFHPHTTWSSIHPASVQAVAADAGQHARIEHLGILRAYMTRHGNGPLPTHDARLDHLPEPHNASDGWQGRFRRGHPDALLLRYALQAVGPLDGLLVSHLDVFGREPSLRWCTGYEDDAASEDLCTRDPVSGRIDAILPGAAHDLAHQERLGRLLARAKPHYAGESVSDASAFVAQLETLTGLPVLLGSHGPTHEDVVELASPKTIQR
ncbi:MAG TPA: adenylosuccinate synthetase [Telluria sp.]|jgi:adenylosuccinate synthase